MSDFVTACTDDGREMLVPRHYLANPVLGAGLSEKKPAKPTKQESKEK